MYICEEQQANLLRSRYIQAFIDQSREQYQTEIAYDGKYVNRFYYSGYLWDCIRDVKVISKEECLLTLDRVEHFYALWDVHLYPRTAECKICEYPRDAVLKLHKDEYRDLLLHLPEDIYFFDDSFSWSVVLTHEEVDGAAWCLSAKPFLEKAEAY